MNFKTEPVTRSTARWSSAAAAIIFCTAFITDERLSWNVVSGPPDQIGLMVTLFVLFAGYALAWTKRYEVLGSVIALVSMIAAYVVCYILCRLLYGGFCTLDLPSPFFLAVGLPALIHLVAVVLHRHEEYGGKASSDVLFDSGQSCHIGS